VETGGIARLAREGRGLFLAFEGDHGFLHRRKEKEVGEDVVSNDCVTLQFDIGEVLQIIPAPKSLCDGFRGTAFFGLC